MTKDFFNAKDILDTSHGQYVYYRLDALEKEGHAKLSKLPISIRVLLEAALRQINEKDVTSNDVITLAGWTPKVADRPAMPFKPGRVIMQDFTGVPAVVDLAAMRSAMARLGGDPKKINPVIPVDLVIDHSVQVDFFASEDALDRNAELEFARNKERYEFLHWGQKAFDKFRVVPPATGIVHQVNLEYLAKGVLTRKVGGETVAFPDTLVGTDSHTTMINGLGVVGWGVGGIEAEAAILGQSLDMLTPDVVGFKLSGEIKDGVTPTDLTLVIVQMLRAHGVVGNFVEFFGPGLKNLSLADRAMIANMSPENGATITFFPVDDETLSYLRLSGRTDEEVELVEAYYKAQGLFHSDEMPDPEFTSVLELDISTVNPSLAGPKLPHERISLEEMKTSFQKSLVMPKSERGFELKEEDLDKEVEFGTNGSSTKMSHGSLVIAAITSCTNTSNPFVMVSAGLVAKKAIEKGLKVKPYVKTSLAPGSRVVTDYLVAAGLDAPLAELGFNVVGYGCTTCIGNSGPLPGAVVKAVTSKDLVAASVLSGNRNFEGRIHAYSLANYLASPPLVVAFALAGTVDIDLTTEPLGEDDAGNPVYLSDIWPSSEEVKKTVLSAVQPEMFKKQYSNVFTINETWNNIQGGDSDVYDWKEDSTYIQEPPFFTELSADVPNIAPIKGAKVMALLNDSITTDHISPAGAIPANGPAGQYLQEHDVAVNQFNSFGSRRGNDRVMTRGTFANIRLKNQLVPGVEGGFTKYHPTSEQLSIFDAAQKYKKDGTPLVVLAGKMYGTGSSRDWAAKGTLLLGVKAVIAESYERIHRSNLVGMGVLPLQFKDGDSASSLGLDGNESFDISGMSNDMPPQSELTVTATKADGSQVVFSVDSRLDTEIDVEYYRNGGILHTVLRDRL
ncbi:MAG: aconitate hydratase AcnA [Chloroflexi bacterium]|jgi:aconitate hydratase|nr:aconitate hydratase AcnA [Chloroflexota bacterium]MBT3670135.1 aconitate hydratase AcnA [Chloroflexota bacterium]MBT4682815.1 aconitate hydratase AcnA [Chloroflexota bacterium]MBT4755143.1 aconitate hydratase AcnA [Chloroflexota bacterium]MBT5336640.1 aconitate hydratase AcnA [Chloroflexota bacterium]